MLIIKAPEQYAIVSNGQVEVMESLDAIELLLSLGMSEASVIALLDRLDQGEGVESLDVE